MPDYFIDLFSYVNFCFQMIVAKSTSRGFPTTLKTLTEGYDRNLQQHFWVDDLVQQLRANDRKVGIIEA